VATQAMRDDYQDYAHAHTQYGHAYPVPGPFPTLDDLRAAHRANAGHYFDADANRFFGARYHSDIIAGRFFIDSIRYPDGRREYRVKLAGGEACTPETARTLDGDPMEYATLSDARRGLRELLDALDVSEHTHDVCPPVVARALRIGELLPRGVFERYERPTIDQIQGTYRPPVATYTTRTLQVLTGEQQAYVIVSVWEDTQRVEVRCAGHILTASLPYAAGAHDVADMTARLLGDMVIAHANTRTGEDA
jgi:hypothetical protein